MYFSAVDSVRTVLIQHINAEQVRLDISSWYLSDHLVSIAIANRFAAGVTVRIVGDRVSPFETDPHTKKEYYWLASRGIPIRLRTNPSWFPEIDHWKMALFVGQNIVTFGSANFTAPELAPISSTNYVDNTTLFTDDPAIVNAFKTKFDVMWNDTTVEPQSIVPGPPYLQNWDEACATEHTGGCADYQTQFPIRVPMVINTARLEPDYPMPADLVWGQGADFNNRLIQEINAEHNRIDLATFRLEQESVADALLAKFRAGVPVRLIVDPVQYTNIKWPEYWLTHANIDKLWAAGVPVLQSVHQGGMHLKMLVTSQYATNASSNIGPNWQRDHNYFVPALTKPTLHRAMADRFEIMWADRTGFAPLRTTPPRAAALTAPVSGTMDVVPTSTLVWARAPWAVSYDVYLGMSSSSLTLVGNVPAVMTTEPPATYSWTPQVPLQAGTRYWWRVVSRTNATPVNPSMVAQSATWSFTTRGVRANRNADFDGDGKTDVSVFRPVSNTWHVRFSSSLGNGLSPWGGANDQPVPADYDGDGRDDTAVFRGTTGQWFVSRSSNGTLYQVSWGAGSLGDVPVPADYDGDGKADIAVYRGSTGQWFVLRSSNGSQQQMSWGSPMHGDTPVPADYDGDGRTDLAVYRAATGDWFILRSRTNALLQVAWGSPQLRDVPVAADYDGDGNVDVAVYRSSTGEWFILRSQTGTLGYAVWGLPSENDVPVPSDYDGDHIADIAVFRPASGTWHVVATSTGTPAVVQWGASSDIPL